MMSSGHFCEVSELLHPLWPQGCKTFIKSGKRERERESVP